MNPPSGSPAITSTETGRARARRTSRHPEHDAAEMNRLVRLWGTSIGRKLLIAASGAFLVLFLLGHIAGNLQVFQGPDVLNDYAAWLKGHPLLWFFRLALLAAFGVHVYLTISLARDNRAARPERYVKWRAQSSRVSRFMAVTGVLILMFVIYHLLHFTFGVVQVNHAQYLNPSTHQLDVYAMVVQSFSNPWISAVYIVAMVLLGIHLVHGTVSVFQTIGLHHESYAGLVRMACLLLVAAFVIGSVSIPLLIALGRIHPPGGLVP